MSLPKNLEEFCKAVARLAIEYEITRFELRAKHPQSHWSGITATWDEGTHGSGMNKLHIESKEHYHVTLDGKPFNS